MIIIKHLKKKTNGRFVQDLTVNDLSQFTYDKIQCVAREAETAGSSALENAKSDDQSIFPTLNRIQTLVQDQTVTPMYTF